MFISYITIIFKLFEFLPKLGLLVFTWHGKGVFIIVFAYNFEIILRPFLRSYRNVLMA